MRVPFESHFESGDLSEWGVSGATLTTAGGLISAQEETPHRGQYAARISTTETGEHVVLHVGGEWSELVIDFWVNVAANYETQNWPILHIDAVGEAGLEQLWDVGLDSSEGDGYRLFLWEMPAVSGAGEGTVAARSVESFAPGVWTQLQVHLRATPDESGFIRVALNGERILDLSERPAGTGDPLQLGFGSFAFGLEPRPADYFLDDVSIRIP